MVDRTFSVAKMFFSTSSVILGASAMTKVGSLAYLLEPMATTVQNNRTDLL